MGFDLQMINELLPKDLNENYRIKFYNDFKMTVNGKEYIMSKEKIRQSVYNTYHYDLPIKNKKIQTIMNIYQIQEKQKLLIQMENNKSKN